MKTRSRETGEMDSARFALFLGLIVGLGIAVHEGFFLIAGAVVLAAIAATVMHALHQRTENTRLAYRAR
jgi:hypothetical protein